MEAIPETSPAALMRPDKSNSVRLIFPRISAYTACVYVTLKQNIIPQRSRHNGYHAAQHADSPGCGPSFTSSASDVYMAVNETRCDDTALAI